MTYICIVEGAQLAIGLVALYNYLVLYIAADMVIINAWYITGAAAYTLLSIPLQPARHIYTINP